MGVPRGIYPSSSGWIWGSSGNCARCCCDTSVWVFRWTHAFLSHVGTLSGTRGAQCSCFTPRNCQIVFLSHCNILGSTRSVWRGQILPVLANTSYYLSFWLNTLVEVKWHLTVAFIFFSLRANDLEHLFPCFLVVCLSSLEKYLFESFAHL